MAKRVEPRHFYLNEQHELSRLEREGGGRLPKLGTIDWGSKQQRLTRSLRKIRQEIANSADPLRESRYFLLARPEKSVPKLTDNKKKALSGRFEEAVDYAGKDSRILGRLGLDVLNVTEEGSRRPAPQLQVPLVACPRNQSVQRVTAINCDPFAFYLNIHLTARRQRVPSHCGRVSSCAAHGKGETVPLVVPSGSA